MPAFVDTMTFGGQMLSLDGKSAGEVFAGAEYTTSNKGVQTAVGASKGIDLGALLGNYKDRYHLRLLVCKAFAGTSATHVEVRLYSSSSATCTTDDEKLCLRVPVATFNKCTQSPYEVSLPPDTEEYNTIGITLVNGSTAVAFTTGAVIATIEDKRW